MASPDTDLSGGDVSPFYLHKDEQDLKEELHRRTWKGVAFWMIFLLTMLFIGIFLIFLKKLYCAFPQEIGYENLILLGIFAAIPSTLLAAFIKLVTKSTDNQSAYDFHPLAQAIQALVDAFRRSGNSN